MSDEKTLEQVVEHHLRPLDPNRALSSGDEWRVELGRWAEMIRGGAVPKGETPVTCIAKARYGAAFGWDPVVSINKIYLVDGRPCLAAESMNGLIRKHKPDYHIEKVSHDAAHCTIRTYRRGEQDLYHEVTFDETDASRAGLLKKNNWQKWPKSMYWARALSQLCREVFADVTLGVGVIADEEAAEYDKAGRVVQLDREPDIFDGLDDDA